MKEDLSILHPDGTRECWNWFHRKEAYEIVKMSDLKKWEREYRDISYEMLIIATKPKGYDVEVFEIYHQRERRPIFKVHYQTLNELIREARQKYKAVDNVVFENIDSCLADTLRKYVVSKNGKH